MSGLTAKERRIVRLFLVLCAVPLLLVFPYLSTVNNPNENVRTYMTMAIVEQRTFRIDDMIARHGWCNDMALVPGKNGEPAHHYSVKAPAASYMAVPGYWAFTKIAPKLGHAIPQADSTPEARTWWLKWSTWVCRFFAVQIPCVLFLFWLERYLRAFTADASLRLTAVAAAGLGTNYVAYNHLFASHSLFAIAGFCGFAITERELRLSRGDPKRRRASAAFLAGFCTGWMVLLEYHSLPMALVVAIFGAVVFHRPTRLLAYGIGGAIHAAAMMFFQWKAYGNPFTPGHKMVENQTFAAEHHKGLFGIVLPSKDAFKSISLDFGFGFFGLSPYMWIGLAALPLAFLLHGRDRQQTRHLRRVTVVWALAMLALWLANAGFLHYRGGWTVGPRYLGAAPPFFAFGAVCALELLARHGAPRPILRGVAGGLAIASVLSIGLTGIVYNSLPEQVSRPLQQFALPMARTGHVPHHLLEWFGVTSVKVWYFAAACLLLAPVLGAALKLRSRVMPWLGQLALVAVVAWIGLRPAFSKPDPTLDDFNARGFMDGWEPPGRDRLTQLRERAEKTQDACLWVRISTIERAARLTSEADRDAAKANGKPIAHCPRVWF